MIVISKKNPKAAKKPVAPEFWQAGFAKKIQGDHYFFEVPTEIFIQDRPPNPKGKHETLYVNINLMFWFF